MAYSRRRGYKTARRPVRRASGGYGRVSRARRAPSRRSAGGRQQTVRIVLEHHPARASGNVIDGLVPGMSGKLEPFAPPRRSKF